MSKTYTFRITAEGVAAVKQSVEAMGASGTAAVQQLQAAMPGLAAAMKGVDQQVAAEAARTTAKLGAEAAKLRDQLDPLAAQARKTTAAIADYDRMLAAGMITKREYAMAAARANAELAKVEATGAAAGRGVQLAAHQVTNLSMQIQDVGVQLAAGTNPFLVMAQQGPQATMAVGGLGNMLKLLFSPTMAVVTALGGLSAVLIGGAMRANDLATNARDLGVSIRGMGRDAEVSAGQLQATVDALTRMHVAGAKEIAFASIATPGVSAARGQQLADLAPDLGAGGRMEAAKAMEELIAIAKDGVPAIEKLDEKFNFLSRSELASIRTMAEHGQQAKVLDATIEALQRRFGGLHEASLSPGEKAIGALANSWRDLTDAIAKSEMMITIVTRLGDALRYYVEASQNEKLQQNPLVKMTDAQAALAVEEKRLATMEANRTQFAQPQIDAVMQRIAAMKTEIETLRTDARKLATGIGDPTRGKRIYDEPAGPNLAEPADPRTKAVDTYVKSLDNERRVLAAGLPDRARARAAIEAETYAREHNLGPTDAARVKAAMMAKATAEATDAINQQIGATDRTVIANRALADAWGAGREEVAAVTLAMGAYAEAATKDGVVIAEWIRQQAALNASVAGLDLARDNAAMDERTQAMAAMAAATMQGAAAVRQAQIDEQVRKQTLEAVAALKIAEREGDAEGIALLRQQIELTRERVTAEVDGAAKAKAAGEYRQRDQDLANARLAQQVALETDPARRSAAERSVASRQEELRLLEQYPGMQAEVNRLLQQYMEIYDTQATTKYFEEVRDAGAAMAGDLRGFLVDGLTSVGNEGRSIFHNMFDALEKMAIRGAANLVGAFAEQQIFIPISTALVGAMPSVFGVSQPAGGQGGGVTSAVGGMAQQAGSNWMSNLMPSPTSFMPEGFFNVMGQNPFGIWGGMGNIAQPGAGWLGAAMPSVFGAGFGPVLGLEAGAASMGAAGLGLTAAEAATLGTGMAPGALAGVAGFASVAVPIAAAVVVALIASGVFADDQNPRGNAQMGAFVNGRFTTNVGRTAPDTALDGYDMSADVKNRDAAVKGANSIMDSLGLTLDNDELSRAFTAPNGLGGIGNMYGWANNADDWIRRLFSWDKTSNSVGAGAAAGNAEISEWAWMQSSGYQRQGSYDPDTGYVSVLTDDKGKVITQEMWNEAYQEWVDQQTAAAATGGGGDAKSLFNAGGNKSLQEFLDRVAGGKTSFGDVEALTEALNYAATFDDVVKLAGTGLGTLARQTAEFEIAARKNAEGIAKSTKQFITDAEEYFGADSTQAAEARVVQRNSVLSALGLNPATVTMIPGFEGGFSIPPDMTGAEDALTGLAADIFKAKINIEAMRPVLLSLGYTAAQATELINAGIAQTTETLSKAKREAFDLAALSFTAGGSEIAARNNMIKGQKQDKTDWLAAGISEADIDRVQAQQTAQFEANLYQQRVTRLEDITSQTLNARGAFSGHAARDAENYDLAVRQRREDYALENSGLVEAERALLQARLDEKQAVELQVMALKHAIEDRRREEGYLTRTASALSTLVGSQGAADQVEDIQRYIASAEELRNAYDADDAARIRSLQTLEASAVAATRARREQEQYNQVLANVRTYLDDLKTRVEDWRAGIMTGDLSPLGNRAKLAEARTNFDTQYALAQGGDQEAISSIMSYAEALIRAGRDAQSNNAAQGQLIEEILGKVTGLPDAVSESELVRRQIEKLDENITPPTEEQVALMDQLAALAEATRLAVGKAGNDAQAQAEAAALLQGAQVAAVTTGNQLAGTVVAQLEQQRLTLQSSKEIAANTLTASGNTAAAAANTAVAAANTAASTATMASMLSVLQGSFARMGDLGQIMAGVGTLVAANTNNRQAIWGDEVTWLWKIVANTGRAVTALGGVPQYDTGTWGHPGGAAIVHAGEVLIPSLPAGTAVLNERMQRDLFAGGGRPAVVNDNGAVAGAIRNLQAAMADRLDALLDAQEGQGRALAGLRADFGALRRELVSAGNLARVS